VYKGYKEGDILCSSNEVNDSEKRLTPESLKKKDQLSSTRDRKKR